MLDESQKAADLAGDEPVKKARESSARVDPRYMAPTATEDGAKGPAVMALRNSLCTSSSVRYVRRRARFIAPLEFGV